MLQMSWLTELRKPYEITDNDYKYRGKFFGRVSSMGASKVAYLLVLVTLKKHIVNICVWSIYSLADFKT